MAYILCLETSTTVCSVALYDSERLLTFQEYHLEKSHSTLLPSIIETSLASASIAKRQLDAVAVSEGPGSYTGLRIGVSIAKGLCYALDIPLVAVNTLSSMAAGVNIYNKRHALVCPMIDARRMEVYTAVFDDGNKIIEEVSPKIIDESAFAGLLSKNEVWFFGDGAAKCEAILGRHPNATILSDVVPSAKSMGTEAYEKFKSKKFEDVAYFEPFYLKEFRITKPKSAD